MVLLDMAKAFDTDWHKALIHKLNNFKFPLYILKIIQNYLKDRTFAVTVNNAEFSEKSVVVGVPQGGILAPCLFIYYTSDLPTHKCVKVALIADDIALYVSSLRRWLALKHIQEYLNILVEYYEKWKLKINSEKTELIVFSNAIKEENKKPYVVIDGVKVEIKRNVKYLGYFLDHKLSHNYHIKETKNKAYIIAMMLHHLIGRASTLSQKNKLILYKQIVRPILLYAVAIWSNTSETQYGRLQVF